MKHINVSKIIDFVGLVILIVNFVLMAILIFVENNPIIIMYKLIFVVLLVINTIILLLISLFRKNKKILVNILVIVLMLLIARLKKPSISEDEIWKYRNKVVQEIESGKYEIKDGVIYLPEGNIYESVSDTKRVILAVDGDRTVCYFFKNAGMLEESCGYIYYTDKVDKNICNVTYDFINKKQIDGNWYFCSTR